MGRFSSSPPAAAAAAAAAAAVVVEAFLLLLVASFVAAAGVDAAFRPAFPAHRHRHCHHGPPRSRAAGTRLSLSSSSPRFSDEAGGGGGGGGGGPRAGSSGYSILRRPLDWDPSSDPAFDAPSSLRDEDDRAAGRRGDEEWFAGRRQQNQGGARERWKGGGGKRRGGRLDGGELHAPEKSESHRRNEESAQEIDLRARTLDALDYPLVLGALSDECATVPARAVIARELSGEEVRLSKAHRRKKKKQQDGGEAADPDDDVLTMPLTAPTAEGARRRYAAVGEMRRLLLGYDGKSKKLRPPPMRGISFDLEPILELTDRGQVLEGPEILEVASTLRTLEELRRWGDGLAGWKPPQHDGDRPGPDAAAPAEREEKFAELPRLASHIDVDPELLALLKSAFDDSGRLSGDAFPAVGRLRAKVRALKRDVLSRLDALLAAPSVSSKLSLESGGPTYSEVNGRIVIPVSEKHGNAVGIVHDISRSGKTSYVEPTELVGPTNEMRGAEAELRAEEARVWRSLTESVLERRAEIERGVGAAAQIDLVGARVRLGETLGGTVPEVGSEGVISLREARHPVLLLRDLDDVVPNDVSLGEGANQGLVLTGPNSGGKTVILKLLGLVALMARDGIPIPAAAAAAATGGEGAKPRVDFFDPVLADIGDLQSVDGDLSTFSGHMLVCKKVLEQTTASSGGARNSATDGANSLVLMDELGSGTDPAQGVAIARALLESLLDSNARVAITTHYLELKQLASWDERFAVGGMQFVSGRPTYRFEPGVVGESFALAVAERMELPKRVLDRANELLDSETRRMGELIRDMEDRKAVIDERARELEEKKREMERMEMEMKAQRRKLEQKQLVARREEARKFAAKLEEKERVLEDVLNRLKSDPSRKVVARSWDDVRFVKRDALTEAEQVPSVLRRQREAAARSDAENADLVPLTELRERPDLKVGDTLIVCKKGSMRGKEVEVVKLGNKIEVKMGRMPVRLKMSELALPAAGRAAAGGGGGEGGSTRRNQMLGPNGEVLSKEARRAMAGGEDLGRTRINADLDEPPPPSWGGKRRGGGGGMRLDSNTVDVRGCTFEEAREKCRNMFGRVMTQKDPVVYVLHGHGTGALRRKLRDWLARDRTFVKGWKKAADEDGGDAFTRVQVKKMQF